MKSWSSIGIELGLTLWDSEENVGKVDTEFESGIVSH
jgi:hypothetical protein